MGGLKPPPPRPIPFAVPALVTQLAIVSCATFLVPYRVLTSSEQKGDSLVKESARDINNVVKRGGHLVCFHATMQTNTVVQVTFGYLRAQQISSNFFSMQRVASHGV